MRQRRPQAAALARASFGAVVLVSTLGAPPVLAVSATGCINGRCGGDAREYCGGHKLKAARVYETGDPDEAYLPFERGVTYTIHHGLGVTPLSTVAYVSFEDHPNGQSGNSMSAGNIAVTLEETTEFVKVQNQTCSDFFLRVVVTGDPDQVPATVGNACGDAGTAEEADASDAAPGDGLTTAQ